ncbi:Monooxygenase asqM [Fulvia fulva]|uniref:Monooxygenase asqM n=1 Tax=Passalora fulva TaxID=5499 RepID=A0A9Q8P9G1_PASFU|nr:Monooxygenase asqM [Fulvia fulva]KAK4624391.1 Monooxygenase asqM [Fulvia fulva]KAK4625514.1 Monooxygenase asqM [Fulvia fulva]UJO18224.1 Monooxygenase asqM [Fulvia fulva]WPV15255.1 Monooxygenase asqM [Fulvia fulva]WPV29714.1 Monooxygenase asqM [Fulvia fulva]
MSPTQPPIAILGAGPAGLTLARLLRLAHMPYKIFERDPSPTHQGLRSNSGTLDIHANTGQLALQKAGLLDAFKAKARWNVSTTIADKDGKVAISMQGEGEQDRPEIDRKDLRGMLLDSVEGGTVRWGAKVREARKGVDGLMDVCLVNGEVESGFKLVVGADGAWSKVRSLITSSKPQYSGVTYLTTSLHPDNPHYAAAASLAGRGNYIGMGDRKMIVVMKLGSDAYYIAVGLWMSENFKDENTALVDDPDKLRQSILEQHFTDWPKTHTDLIRHSDGHFHVWPLYSLPTDAMDWQSVPGVTLVGDAAHLAVTNGDGVNVALFDSYCLAEQIIKHGQDNLDAAVAEYEKDMFPRGVESIKGGQQWVEVGFGPDAPASVLQAFGVEPGADPAGAPKAEATSTVA